MSYETAPATKLVATNCACCGRPLVDAVSVETGIGPDCREKYGYNIPVAHENRAEANSIVRSIALNRKASNVPALCAKLSALGFKDLSNKLVGRLAKVVVTEKDGMFAVKTPYNENLVAAMRAVPGRRWMAAEKLNYFPVSQKAALFDLLKRFFNGETAVGPKGVFVIGAVAALPVVVERVATSTCEYMDGEPCEGNCNACEHNQDEADLYRGPQPGTWAYEAREMVRSGLMSGDEADHWKDMMKDGAY